MADPIGKRIQLRRQALRLTQQQLADKLGVDRSTVSAWERGKQPPARNEGALQEVLGISFAEPGAEFVPLNEDEATIWGWHERYSEEQRRTLIDKLRSISNNPHSRNASNTGT